MSTSKYQVLQERFDIEENLKERILGSIFIAFHENLAKYLECDPAAIKISIGNEEIRGSSVVVPFDTTIVITSADASKTADVSLGRIEAFASTENDRVAYKLPGNDSQYGT